MPRPRKTPVVEEGLFPFPCADCGNTVHWTMRTFNRGSIVREPGEALCMSCSSVRSKMVRELDAIPCSLADIKGKKRWADIGSVKPSARFA